MPRRWYDLTGLDDDEEYARNLQHELNLEDGASGDFDGDEIDPVIIDDDSDAGDGPVFEDLTTQVEIVQFPNRIELELTTLKFGTVKSGDTVELADHSEHHATERRTGDFLTVKKIVEDLETSDVYLCGDRLVRCSYEAPLFDAKLNDVAIVKVVNRHDPHPWSIQGIEEVLATEAIARRDCRYTTQSYRKDGLRTAPLHIPRSLKNESEMRNYIFHSSPLYCRWVFIKINESNGKTYGGEVRRLYKREADEHELLCKQAHGLEKTYLRRTPANHERNQDEHRQNSSAAERRRSDSVETVDHEPSRRRAQIAGKKAQTFGDVFCGAGGASFGAVVAGLIVKFGVEIIEEVIQSYHRNHPGAMPLHMNAHDLPAFASRSFLAVDLLHFSTVCAYFSIAHREGKNDQANYETIFVVGPTLGVLKPPYACAEQVPGLMIIAQHQMIFRTFLNSIIEHGYNIRYQIMDFAGLGLPQRRRRLLFNMSKIGYPLAPFPNPTHGPKASGLKRFVTVADALEPLEQIPRGLRDDRLHRPDNMKRYNATAYDPYTTQVRGCLTKSGGDNYHYSGKRKNTARENSKFQTFPLSAQFEGSLTSVTEQIGNAYPPDPAAQHFLQSAMTREAFEHGLIDAEEDIRDLWITLKEKGIEISKDDSRYLYLTKLEKNAAHPFWIPRSPFARIGPIEPRPREQEGRPFIELD